MFQIIWFQFKRKKKPGKNVFAINRHFIPANNKHKIFKRNLKVSYSCNQNISQIIKGHNKKVTQIRRSHQLEYNLRIETECALNGSCRKEGLRYMCATLTPF